MNESLLKQLGGTYHEENGYFIPDLRLPAEEEQPIGTCGQGHPDHLRGKFPLFCPKCKQETLRNVRQMNMSVIREPDAEPMNL